MHLQAPAAHQRSPRRAQQGQLLRQPLRLLSGNTPTLRLAAAAAAVGSGQGNRRGNDKLPHLLSPAPPRCRDDQEEQARSPARPGHVGEKMATLPSPPRGCEGPGGWLKAKGDRGGESRSAKRARRSRGGGLPAEQWEEPEEEAVSVGETVALPEQRGSERQVASAPLLSLRRSTASITLTRPGPAPRPGSEVGAEAVWDLVARLESERVKSPSGLRGVGRVLLAGTPSPPPRPDAGSPPESRTPAQLEALKPGRTEVQRPRGYPQDPAEPQTPSCEEEEEEPPPGKLFFSQSLVQNISPWTPEDSADGGRGSSQGHPPTSLRLPSTDSCGALELERRRSPGGEALGCGASQEFLEARFKLQLLLEPRSSLLLLPQHLLLHILSLLPTRSLAALKCSCQHFSSLIEVYGVRPVDSRWEGDPRYRDDPCKQCKRQYRRGDVSLCRWHHKPYCQALPYGPGFWMCCHGVRRDAPGCNVGVHENGWVPRRPQLHPAPLQEEGGAC